MGAQGWVCATYTKLQGKSAGPCPKIRGQHTLEGLCSPTQRQQRPAYKVSILGQNHCQHMGTSCAKKAIAICIRLAAWVITDWSAQAHPQPRAAWHHTGRPNRGGPGQAHKTAEGLVMSGKKYLRHVVLIHMPCCGLACSSPGLGCLPTRMARGADSPCDGLLRWRCTPPCATRVVRCRTQKVLPQPQCMHSNILPRSRASMTEALSTHCPQRYPPASAEPRQQP